MATAKPTGKKAAARKPAAKPAGKATTRQTIKPKAAGQKAISFKSGGLHESLGVPAGQLIPAAKMASALAGNEGPKAKAQAEFAKNVLTGKKSSRKKKKG